MDSNSDALDLEFGADPDAVDDLAIAFLPDLWESRLPQPPRPLIKVDPQVPGPGELESRLAAPPAPPRMGFELQVPELPRRTKTIIAIAAGGAVGGFLVGGPVGSTVGAVLGFLMA